MAITAGIGSAQVRRLLSWVVMIPALPSLLLELEASSNKYSVPVLSISIFYTSLLYLTTNHEECLAMIFNLSFLTLFLKNWQ